MDRPSTVYESRYRILAVFVFVLLAIQTSNQQWSWSCPGFVEG